MDEKLRQRAKHAMARAKELNDGYSSDKDVLAVYLIAAEQFAAIESKTTSDYKDLIAVYHKIAINFFNLKNPSKAAEYYYNCIQMIQKLELDDNAYRTLTERYIDLADAFFELFNQPAANEATANAINAFKAIKVKTEEELALGDPMSNFALFHHYYQRQLSTSSYIKSTPFQNHAKMLQELQEEQALYSQFSGISIGEQQQLDNSIEAMLTQLSLAEPKQSSLFTPTLFSPVPDSAYRNTAVGFLRLAKEHVQKGAVKSVISTYEQAIGALRLISGPSDGDGKIITELTQQIAFLKKKPQLVSTLLTALPTLKEEDMEMEEDNSFRFS